MGLHAPSGRVVVVTNVRGEMPDPARESRGALVVDLLRGTGRFADPDEAELDRFNAFNLFAVDGTARLFTNRPGPRILALTPGVHRSEEHTSELQSLMRISYAVFCLKKKKQQQNTTIHISTSIQPIQIDNSRTHTTDNHTLLPPTPSSNRTT